MADELRILSPTAILGYGFPEESLAEGLRRGPHVIAVDAGSTDPGPHFLGLEPGTGLGHLAQFSKTIDADLRPLLKAARGAGIPLIIGSAGGAGGDLHLLGMAVLAKNIAREEGLRFKLALIQAEIEKAVVHEKLDQGKVRPLGPAPELTHREIEKAVRIVAHMGVEPFIAALEEGAEVIIAGRASDPGMFAALPVMAGFDRGVALHLGKVLECGALAAEPGSGSDCILGTIRPDHFLVEPLNPVRRCTPRSVAGHSMYEADDPWRLAEPGGVVDLTEVKFAAESDRCVRVSGSRFQRDPVYRIKLEGAALAGYRAVCIAGIRDPAAIAHLDLMLKEARTRAAERFADLKSDWSLHFRVYGRDGVMGAREPVPRPGHEVGLLMEAIAPTQEAAMSICLFVHSFLLHFGYPGRVSTAGNLAFPFSPQDLPLGPVHRFNIYHLMEVDDPLSLFPRRLLEVADE